MLVHVDSPEIIKVSSKNRLITGSSSKGNQFKYAYNNKFIKLNTWKWYEDISEVLVSYLLGFTDIDYYVKYYPCSVYKDEVYKGVGCYSDNFLGYGESDITFARLLKHYGNRVTALSYDMVRDEISDIVGFDIKRYLDRCLCLDAITFNEDRHLNNLSVIRTSTGFREAPIYDNGLSCLSDVFTYEMNKPLEYNLKLVHSATFSTDFLSQIKGNNVTPLCIDTKKFFEGVHVETPEEERALEVIRIGLERTRGIAWEEF